MQDVPQNELTDFARGWTANDVNSWPRGLDKVDVLVAGEAFSEFAARIGNIVSCSARAEINLVNRKDGKVVRRGPHHHAGGRSSENIAGKKALQNSGRAMGIRLLEHFAETLPAESRQRRRKNTMNRSRAWWLCCFLTACPPLQAATRVALVSNLDDRTCVMGSPWPRRPLRGPRASPCWSVKVSTAS